MKKLYGYLCDKCLKHFTYEPVTAKGKKRELHFCSLKCKAKYLKIRGITTYHFEKKDENISENS